MRQGITYDIVFFIAMLATALALGGALAHAFELANKINLPADEYFIVQKAYQGWNRLAYPILVEFLSLALLVVLARRQRVVQIPAALALVSLVAAQVVFWVYTSPANVATEGWTTIPDNWAALRRQWEYSHAAGALFQLLAMSSLAVASINRARAAEATAARHR
jgi:hypothetical protein